METLETKRLHIVPTAMGRIPLSGLRRGVRGADATNYAKIGGHLLANHKLATEVMTFKRFVAVADPSPYNASKICCAFKPSLPHELPLGNNSMQLKTLSIFATRGAQKNVMQAWMGWLSKILSLQAFNSIITIWSYTGGG
ncbi:hypothetical protein Tco_0951787 [Tanacetum coccineum]|uniref:Uncharacterized protein n=1 Tax=Tanacetum coccineum TaxID=301880 RepID=A0ABQ5DVV9_9ASTR